MQNQGRNERIAYFTETELAAILEVLNADQDYQAFVKSAQIDKIRMLIGKRIIEGEQPPVVHHVRSPQMRPPMPPQPVQDEMFEDGGGDLTEEMTPEEWEAMYAEEQMEGQGFPQQVPPEQGGYGPQEAQGASRMAPRSVPRPNWMNPQGFGEPRLPPMGGAGQVPPRVPPQPQQVVPDQRRQSMMPNQGRSMSPSQSPQRSPPQGDLGVDPQRVGMPRSPSGQGGSPKAGPTDDFGDFTEEEF